MQAQSTTLLTEHDLYLFNEGTHHRIYEKFGAHRVDGGVYFAVWAPNAEWVSVIGGFNAWDKEAHPLSARGESGIWEGFVPGLENATAYKYHVRSRYQGYRADKADPVGFYYEKAGAGASVVWDLSYEWHDQQWMETRADRNSLERPMAVYEVHLGSWRRVVEENNRSLTYRELAVELVEYLKKMNFTHVEFLPVMEHPFYGSWGYQTTGYFAPTSRYGPPQDFMWLIDRLHQEGFAVILDWVPSHFPTDEHGLGYFDGTHAYEHSDPRQGFHPDWNSFIFNYGRSEVRSFLLSSAMIWLDKYHADGLRVDAVASMLHLDFSRKAGEWIPNRYGGRESLEAIDFVKRLNQEAFANYPGVQTIAEESSTWPMVSRPLYLGGLGFGMKWDMGWMHDTLDYLALDPVFRKYNHNQLTFRMMYAYSENFMLPLSHDEVVYGKKSLISKMPGDDWQKFANLRLLYGYMYTQTGKKLLFMGGEFGQWNEWSHDSSLDWSLLQIDMHAQLSRWVEDLNRFYRDEPAMHEMDTSPGGFEWIDCHDADNSVLSYLRRDKSGERSLIVVCNFTPLPRHNYRLGAPQKGHWAEMLNSDAKEYGGSGQGNFGGVDTVPLPLHGRLASVTVTLPPLGIVIFRHDAQQPLQNV